MLVFVNELPCFSTKKSGLTRGLSGVRQFPSPPGFEFVEVTDTETSPLKCSSCKPSSYIIEIWKTMGLEDDPASSWKWSTVKFRGGSCSDRRLRFATKIDGKILSQMVVGKWWLTMVKSVKNHQFNKSKKINCRDPLKHNPWKTMVGRRSFPLEMVLTGPFLERTVKLRGG